MANGATPRPERVFALLFLAVLLIALASQFLSAATGAQVTYVSNSTRPEQTADNRTDEKGTITTVLLNAIEQDQHWKAYVGNVTGSLVLDDASSYRIYDWDLTGVTITGEVYVSRYSAPTFSTVSCADATDVVAEHTFHNMTSSGADNVNKTFNSTAHRAFYVGTQLVTNSTCQSTTTFINSTRQAVSESALFQEILLQDAANHVLYTTLLENDIDGYENATTLRTYDFQILVPESDVKSTPTTYYFFTEIGS